MTKPEPGKHTLAEEWTYIENKIVAKCPTMPVAELRRLRDMFILGALAQSAFHTSIGEMLKDGKLTFQDMFAKMHKRCAEIDEAVKQIKLEGAELSKATPPNQSLSQN